MAPDMPKVGDRVRSIQESQFVPEPGAIGRVTESEIIKRKGESDYHSIQVHWFLPNSFNQDYEFYILVMPWQDYIEVISHEPELLIAGDVVQYLSTGPDHRLTLKIGTVVIRTEDHKDYGAMMYWIDFNPWIDGSKKSPNMDFELSQPSGYEAYRKNLLLLHRGNHVYNEPVQKP